MRVLAYLVAALGVLAVSGTAWAQSVQRVQTRIIERAVSRNLDTVFRPKLVINSGATGPVTALALSHDERHLVTGVGNNTLRVWDLWVGREIARLSGHAARITNVAISRDGRRAISVDADRAVKVWNLGALGEVASLGTHPSPVTGMALAGNDSGVFIASSDGHIRATALQDGKVQWDVPAHAPGVVKLVVAADGRRLVSAGADGAVRVWDAATGKATAEIAWDSPVQSLALSADDKRIAAGNSRGEIALWSMDGTRMATVESKTDRILSIAFVGDGGSLVAGGADGAVVQVSPGGEAPRTLGKHDAPVSYMVVSADSSFALSASEDGTSRLWSLRGGTHLLTLVSTETGWAVIDAKGRYDGNQQALNGIDWQADSGVANIEDFAETHYQPALLPRTLQNGEIAAAADIPAGVSFPPSVRFLSPASAGGAEARSVVVEVVAEDKGGGVSEVRLYRNGKLLPRNVGQVERQDVDGRAQVKARYQLDLGQGGNVLSATAINNERLESRPQTLTLAEGPRPPGRLHLLTVGVNRYKETKLNLEYARPDARAIRETMGAELRSSHTVAEVVTLEDEKATKETILAALRQFRAVPSDDVVVVYMAGHGVSVGDDWYFISHETLIPRDQRQLSGHALSSAELKAEMEALSADRTLLLLDTCHSGTAVSPLKDYRGMKALRLLARSVGTHVLAATDRQQYAVELEALGHGIFTYTVLSALGGNGDINRDGTVSVTELINFVENAVPPLSKKYADYAQYPTGYSRGSDFQVSRIVPGK